MTQMVVRLETTEARRPILFSERLPLAFIVIALILGVTPKGACQMMEKPRLLILTDIGGDPDDIQSLRRLLVYSNEFSIEGLIATASQNKRLRTEDFDGYFVNDSIIHMAIDDYGKVRDQLAKHASGFPEATMLHKVTRAGQVRRVAAPGMSTPGSEHIIEVVDASNEILNIAIWGGAHDLGQALLDVRARRGEEGLKTFVSRLVVFAIADQHTKQPGEAGSGKWIVENFPEIRYIQSGGQEVMSASFRGMYQNDAAGPGDPVLPLVRPGIENLNSTAWILENVSAWGPLGAGYPERVTQNPRTTRNTTGVKEGDTPSWFYFLINGLSDPAFPEWGGWGGRYMHQHGNYYADAQDHHWSGTRDASVRRKWTVARWREAFQNDFAARMRWCTRSVDEANHNPRAMVNGDDSKAIIFMTAKAGSTVSLDASGSDDPDADKLSFYWWIYPEVSSATASLSDAGKAKAKLRISESTGPGEVHVILEVRDSGQPQLTSYRRVIVKVEGR